MRIPEQLHALAATARIANAPSVAGNVFLGLVLAQWAGHAFEADRTALVLISGVSLYFAGNFLNDWADRRWDAERRPERALPRGLFRPETYLTISCLWGLLGLGTAAAAHAQSFAVALIIAFLILIYTWTHKRAVWSVIPMGLCRAMLPALGFSGLAGLGEFPTAVALSALGLFCHIAGLSLSARGESMESAPTGFLRFAKLWFLPSALSMGLVFWQGLSIPFTFSLVGLVPYGLWTGLCLTVFRKPVAVHVSNLLAGIPLVDWIVLLPLALTAALPGPLSQACMFVPPLAFLTGKALQRLAPAT